MYYGHDCQIESSQCIIREITEFHQNILGVFFFVLPLFHALDFYIGSFHQKFG